MLIRKADARRLIEGNSPISRTFRKDDAGKTVEALMILDLVRHKEDLPMLWQTRIIKRLKQRANKPISLSKRTACHWRSPYFFFIFSLRISPNVPKDPDDFPPWERCFLKSSLSSLSGSSEATVSDRRFSCWSTLRILTSRN